MHVSSLIDKREIDRGALYGIQKQWGSRVGMASEQSVASSRHLTSNSENLFVNWSTKGRALRLFSKSQQQFLFRFLYLLVNFQEFVPQSNILLGCSSHSLQQYPYRMDIDEDGPPQLVEAGDDIAEEEATVKVPITIVTGGYFWASSGQKLSPMANSRFRVS